MYERGSLVMKFFSSAAKKTVTPGIPDGKSKSLSPTLFGYFSCERKILSVFSQERIGENLFIQRLKLRGTLVL
jgi:hypothetical protein